MKTIDQRFFDGAKVLWSILLCPQESGIIMTSIMGKQQLDLEN